VGHGAGYGVYEKLKEGLGADANYIFDTDPISIWLTNPQTLDPKLRRDRARSADADGSLRNVICR
jgi:hypothetical protein